MHKYKEQYKDTKLERAYLKKNYKLGPKRNILSLIKSLLLCKKTNKGRNPE